MPFLLNCSDKQQEYFRRYRENLIFDDYSDFRYIFKGPFFFCLSFPTENKASSSISKVLIIAKFLITPPPLFLLADKWNLPQKTEMSEKKKYKSVSRLFF